MSDDGPKPKKGDVVTFEFDYGPRTVGPANPKINRIRKDVSWEEVLRDYERDAQLNGSPLPLLLSTLPLFILTFFFDLFTFS
jgi:signal peptidase I